MTELSSGDETNRSCRYCEHARQVGDMSRTDVVGCALMTRGGISIYDYVGKNVYEGWMYGGRRPGDTSKSRGIGHGVHQNFSKLVDSDGHCKDFERAITIYEDNDNAISD